MGSLIHIAEVAVLILAAYTAGWPIGYLLHRLVGRPAATVATANSPPLTPATPQPQPDDALVRAPVVVPVAGTVSSHVHPKVTQIELATAVAVPDGMVPAEARTISTPKVAATPVSALETLKSLSTAIPLAPISVTPIAGLPDDPPSTQSEAGPLASSGTNPPPIAIEPQGEAAASPQQTVAAEVPPQTVDMPQDVVGATAGVANVAIVEPQSEETAAEPAAVLEPVVATEPVASVEPVEIAQLAEPEAPAERDPAHDVAPLAPEPEPQAVLAMPSSRAGVAWAGAIKGREASPFERIAETTPDAPNADSGTEQAGLNVTLLDSLADELQVEEPALPIDQLEALAPPMAVAPEPPADPVNAITVDAEDPVLLANEPVHDVAPPIPEPVAEPVVVAPQPARREFDEDAAMRAIEGGWSRRQTRAMSDAYELTDVSAAVSAAQMAVEQVLAANGIDPSEQATRAQAAFGKPRGLPQPRNGRRDNLKQINGLGPLDESTLNNLGVYHFDQIAAWDQKEVLWMENHAFARGRIGREDWQAQARALIDEDASRRTGG